MITVRGGADKRMATITTGTCTYYADATVESGGSGLYPRPGEYLMSAFAACMNMTARGLLNERNVSYEEVVTRVELDRSDLDRLTFFYKTEIIGDMPEGVFCAGFPVQSHAEWLRMQASMKHLPEMYKKFRQLEKKLAKYESK